MCKMHPYIVIYFCSTVSATEPLINVLYVNVSFFFLFFCADFLTCPKEIKKENLSVKHFIWIILIVSHCCFCPEPNPLSACGCVRDWILSSTCVYMCVCNLNHLYTYLSFLVHVCPCLNMCCLPVCDCLTRFVYVCMCLEGGLGVAGIPPMEEKLLVKEFNCPATCTAPRDMTHPFSLPPSRPQHILQWSAFFLVSQITKQTPVKWFNKLTS